MKSFQLRRNQKPYAEGTQKEQRIFTLRGFCQAGYLIELCAPWVTSINLLKPFEV